MDTPSRSLIELMLNYLCDTGNTDFEHGKNAREKSKTVLEIVNFMDEIPGGFLIYRASGNEEIIHANKALLKIFKCASIKEFRELTQNSFRGVVYHKDLDWVEQSIQAQISDSRDDMDYVEYRIMRADGEIRWVEDYGHYIRSQAVGGIFYVFISDITEEKKRRLKETKALMTEKEKKIQTIIEEYDKERNLINQEYLRRLEVIEALSINYNTILYVDLDTDRVLPYRYNHRTGEHFRKSDEPRVYGEYIADYVANWLYPADAEMFVNCLSADFARRELTKNKSYEFTYRVLDRGIRHIHLRVVNAGNENQVSQIVIGSRDIEDDIERDKRQNQVLEDALRNAKQAGIAKDTFLSNMSHDMRTPLNAIFGYTALAKHSADSTEKSYLDKIDVSAKQLLYLIDQVLEISQWESNVYSIIDGDFNIKKIIEKVCDGVKNVAEPKNMSIATVYENVEHYDVRCDGDKLRQVLDSIVSNAVKYTPINGSVKIIVRETRQLPNGYSAFEFCVEDDGVGIDEAALEKIFEPFERVGSTTSSGVYGAGLGLTISKQIIDAMGGEIIAESEVNKGSKFTVRLKLNTSEVGGEENCDEIMEELRGTKILLTDDNEINLEIETEILEDLGFVVDTADDGDVAVEKVKNSKAGEYALVLMDIQMPRMDGRKATELIRKLDEPQLADIPVIALSANAFDSDRKASMECGMDAHLAKPLDVNVLLRTVAKVLRSRR